MACKVYRVYGVYPDPKNRLNNRLKPLNIVKKVSLMAAAVRKFWGEAREDVKT